MIEVDLHSINLRSAIHRDEVAYGSFNRIYPTRLYWPVAPDAALMLLVKPDFIASDLDDSTLANLISRRVGQWEGASCFQ